MYVGKVSRVTGFLVPSLYADEFRRWKTSFGIGGLEVQTQLQWWIALYPASLRASLSLQHGVRCLCASTLGFCVRKAPWEGVHRPPLMWEHSAPGQCLAGSSGHAQGRESL